tara:strand:+ start:35739 stop:36002 length:264 start_codon:yes stop_codon:yes gene_type:complete
MLEHLSGWTAAVVLALSQILLNGLRTLNIKHITNRSIGKAVLSSNALSAVYLANTALGIKSLLEGDLIPFVGFFIGCTLGVWLALRN